MQSQRVIMDCRYESAVRGVVELGIEGREVGLLLT